MTRSAHFPHDVGPRGRSPVFHRDRLVTLELTVAEASVVTTMLRERIRRITWLDGDRPEHFQEIWRISRMCFELAREVQGLVGMPKLTNLASEDVEILYALPMREDLGDFLSLLNQVRGSVRSAGPVNPVMADKAAKGLAEMMES